MSKNKDRRPFQSPSPSSPLSGGRLPSTPPRVGQTEELAPSLTDLRRAYTWKKIPRAGGPLSDLHKEMQGLPVTLRAQGLAPTLALLLKQDKPANRLILDILAAWLLRDAPVRTLPAPEQGGPGRAALYRAVLSAPSRVALLAAEAEAMALCAELKLLSTALVKGGDLEDGHGR